MRDPKWRGIRPHGAGWRATVSRGRSRPQIQKHFPKDTDPREMQAWRTLTAAKEAIARKQRASYGTFEGDAKRYLNAVRAMPTFEARSRHIHEWIAVFGAIQRDRITAADIRTVRDRWATTPRPTTKRHPNTKPDARPLSPGSINIRLRALSNLYAVLDGPRADNPVRDVPELQEPTPAPRPLSYEQIATVLTSLRDSRAKRWLTVMAFTGWPYGVLAGLTAADVDLETGIAYLPARRKGFGAPAVVVPLLPQARIALAAFADEWTAGQKPIRNSVLRRVLKAAARKAGIGWLKPYDLRHLYASTLAQVSGDERAAQAVLQHASLVTTRRYTLRGVPARVTAAVDLLAGHMARLSGQTSDRDPAVSGAKPREAPTARKVQKERKRA